MLDTDIISFWLRGNSRVHKAVESHPTRTMCLSAVTLAELRYGATLNDSAKIHHSIDDFTAVISVVPFDEACTHEFGRIATMLRLRGTPIGDLDTMIAAHATTLDLTLVTNNVRHFTRVDGLRIENWF
jgi:tRNA(fMet)-specific endonuclease VapC